MVMAQLMRYLLPDDQTTMKVINIVVSLPTKTKNKTNDDLRHGSVPFKGITTRDGSYLWPCD